ncbi:hypothetical protein HMPREF9442_02979 [Paraprevotella xylaniphila YIT 11841]|uniref:Uncharacterized protein n=1 Tax=Paraprevotella xylaniphila YIT 11841 TaxID=762982 RepID=F3QXK5_9BACT|nr:hypothetical protein HMPREF9442_02979 [Paraprevotella xylaniphila YIT 11841]
MGPSGGIAAGGPFPFAFQDGFFCRFCRFAIKMTVKSRLGRPESSCSTSVLGRSGRLFGYILLPFSPVFYLF